MKSRSTAFALVLVLLMSLAADTQPALHYLKPDSIDPVALLPDPPKAGSPEDKCELQEVLDQQTSRSDSDVQRAKSEEKLSVFDFADVLGPWFTETNCPKTAALFTEI